MRAFKHTSTKEERELRKLFPTFLLWELHDDSSIIKLPISLWSRWYIDVENKADEIPFDCSEKEEYERYKMFYGLAIDIVNQFDVYGLFYKHDKIKKVRSKQQLISDLERQKEPSRPLLIPSLNAIFNITHDFTAYIYCKNKSEIEPLLNLAQARGLKLIQNT